MERKDYQVEKSDEGYVLDRKRVERLDLKFVPGLCAVDPENPSNPLDFGQYVVYVHKAQGVSDGSKPGSWDDRKFRFAGATIDDSEMIVRLGATYYGEFRKDIDRSYEDNLALKDRGRMEYKDEWAFFTRVPGVGALPISLEGSTFLGERTNEEDTGLVNAAAGHWKFRHISDVDPRVDGIRELGEEYGLNNDVLSVLQNEFGISPHDTVGNPVFVGIYSHPARGDMDFSYIVPVALSNQQIRRAWELVRGKEHKELIELSGMADISNLLERGIVPGKDQAFELMYSTRGELKSVREADLAWSRGHASFDHGLRLLVNNK